MTIIYFPFDAGAGANSLEDRWKKMAQFWRQTGVLPGELNQWEVYADNTGMQVKVRSGKAWIEGFYVESDAEEILAITGADPTNPRIDRVALKLDNSANTIALVVVTGTPDPAPTAPPLNETTSVSWVGLARIAVAAGASSIVPGDVTDERVYSYSDVEEPLGSLSLNDGGTKTIAGSAITVTPSAGEGRYLVDTEGAAAKDDLDTINGGIDGDLILVSMADDAHRVNLITGGNIQTLDGDPIVLLDKRDSVLLRYDSVIAKWRVIGGTYPVSWGISVPLGDGGVNIPVVVWDYYEIPFDGIIQTHRLVAEAAVTIQLDVWKDSYVNWPPTAADSIYGTKPALAAAQKVEDTTLDIPVSKGDWIAVNVDSNTDATRVTLALGGVRKRG